MGMGQQRDVGVLQRRIDADHLSIRLGVDQTREAIAGAAADTAAPLTWAQVGRGPLETLKALFAETLTSSDERSLLVALWKSPAFSLVVGDPRLGR